MTRDIARVPSSTASELRVHRVVLVIPSKLLSPRLQCSDLDTLIPQRNVFAMAGSSAKKPASAKSGQRSILGFFKPPASQSAPASTAAKVKSVEKPKLVPISGNSSRVNLTPAPSSDAIKGDGDEVDLPIKSSVPQLLSPVTPADATPAKPSPIPSSSPSRRAKRTISYAESDDDEEEDVKPASSRRRLVKRQKTQESDDEDAFKDAASEIDEGAFR